MEINKDGKVFIGFIIVLIIAIVGVAYQITKNQYSRYKQNYDNNNRKWIADT